jgi:hypothetical protein
VSVPKNLTQVALSLVAPSTPSMVDPLQAAMKFLPASDRVFIVVVNVVNVAADNPVKPLNANHNSS